MRENVIEWMTGDDTIAVTVSQKKFITRIRQLAEKHPKTVQILAENSDGSIFAHLPLKSLKLTIISLDESRKTELAENMRAVRERREQHDL